MPPRNGCASPPRPGHAGAVARAQSLRRVLHRRPFRPLPLARYDAHLSELVDRVACDAEPVLLGLGVPAMGGLEVTQRIRTLPQTGGVQLVGITGYGHDVDRQRTRGPGFDAHMARPVDSGLPDSWLRPGVESAETPPRASAAI